MLDVHPPHSPTHTWKDFFIHIATIVVGLLIAVGLEQIVEYFHHEHQLAELREALALERKINILECASFNEEWRRMLPMYQNDMAVFLYLRQHPGAPPAQWPGKVHSGARQTVFTVSAWNSALQSGIVSVMPQTEVRRYAALYSHLQSYNASELERRAAAQRSISFGIEERDPSRLSPAEIERTIERFHDLILAVYRAGVALHNLSVDYPDFTAAPAADDLVNIVGIVTADDRKKTEEANRALEQAIDRIDPNHKNEQR